MAIRTYKVTLDSKNTIAPEPVYLRQGDKTGAVVIDATLMDNGSPVSLNGLTPMFKANTADGKAVIADSTGFTVTDSANGKFTYQVPNALSAVPGKITTAYFSLSDADGSESTFDVAFIIKKAVDATKPQADDYITIIDGTLNSLQKKIDAMNTDIQTVLNAYNQGDFYNKSETDSKDAEVTAQLAEIPQQKSTIENFNTSTFSLVLAGIDSLTNGAGESSYLDYFSPRIRGELGDGGPGYVPIDYSFASGEGYGFNKSGGMSYIGSAIPGQYPAKYSFDLKGLYCDAGVEEYFTLKINHKWKHGKLFYLNQTGGGTFKVGYVPENTSIHDVVNTQSSKFSIGVYDFPDNDDAKQGYIKCSSINGKVVIFGGLFWNDEGVAVSRIGQGGRKFADIAKIEPSFLSAWINELSPKMFIFNGGINDRFDMTATDFKLNLESYLLPFKASGTQLTLISPNLTDGDNTRLKEYDEQLIDFANINHVDYLSDAKLFGSYSQANMEGYMFDGIHPNDTGNKKRANNILSYYSIPLIGVNKTELNGSSDNVKQYQYITDLSVKNLYIKAGETEKLYKIGLINGYPNGLIEFTVTGSVYGTAMMHKKIFRSTIANGGAINQVNDFSATPRVTSVDESKWGQITKVDFQLTFESVDNQLLVKITPDSLDADSMSKNMNFTVEGKVTLIVNTVVGQSVFENSIV